jgi:hypothetical protein
MTVGDTRRYYWTEWPRNRIIPVIVIVRVLGGPPLGVDLFLQKVLLGRDWRRRASLLK